ncbi:MAG: FecR family protein [Usitatibacter sp.]
MKTFVKILVAFVLAATAVDAVAQVIGRVLVVSGQVSVIRQGLARPAAIGTGLEVGDSVVTGAASNTQLRFSDASLVALRESSRFLVERYEFQRAGASDSLVFSLLKGGLRTITGTIGKSRRTEAYVVKTPLASVGVRGTQYALLYCNNDCGAPDGTGGPNGMYGGVFDGRVGVFNNAGDVEFGRDEFFFVADINTIPQPLLGPPAFLADRLAGLVKNAPKPAAEPATRAEAAAGGVAPASEEIVVPVVAFAATDTRGQGGAPIVVGSTANTFFAFAHSLIENNGGPASYGGSLSVPPSLVANPITTSGTTLTAFSLEPAAGRRGAVGPGGIDMQGFDPASGVYWGRWRDGTVSVTAPDQHLTPGTQTPGTGVHYMFGAAPTTEGVLAAKAGSFTYSDTGGTTPTDSNGQVATSFNFGPMNVNFTTQTANLSTLSVVFPNASWSYSNVPFALRPAGYNHIDAFAYNVGSCVGAGCGASQGPNNATIDTTGVFLGNSAGFLSIAFQGFSGANITNNRVAWGSVRIFRCAGCP